MRRLRGLFLECRRGERSREDECARLVAQVVDDGALSGDEAAHAGQGFAEGAEDEVDVAADAGGRRAARAVFSEDADAVRVVDVGAEAESPSQMGQAPEVGHAAGHGEDGVGDDEGVFPAGMFAEAAFEVVEAVVDDDASFAGARALDQAGVVVAGGEDGAVLGGAQLADGAVCAQVGEEARGKDERARFADVPGQFAFEGFVQVEVAVEQARAGAAGAVAVDGLVRRAQHLGVVGEPEVVVRAHHDLALSIDRDGRAFGAVEGAEIGVEARGLDERVILEAVAGFEDLHGDLARGASPRDTGNAPRCDGHAARGRGGVSWGRAVRRQGAHGRWGSPEAASGA